MHSVSERHIARTSRLEYEKTDSGSFQGMSIELMNYGLVNAREGWSSEVDERYEFPSKGDCQKDHAWDRT